MEIGTNLKDAIEIIIFGIIMIMLFRQNKMAEVIDDFGSTLKEDTKSFIDQKIDLAIAERDREIVEMLSDEWCKSGKDSNKREYLDDIINLINSKK